MPARQSYVNKRELEQILLTYLRGLNECGGLLDIKIYRGPLGSWWIGHIRTDRSRSCSEATIRKAYRTYHARYRLLPDPADVLWS